jgi:hypothetical protein
MPTISRPGLPHHRLHRKPVKSVDMPQRSGGLAPLKMFFDLEPADGYGVKSSFYFSGAAAMSEYEIELISKKGHSVIGEANDLECALNCFDEAIRNYPRGHIRVRRGATIMSERVPPLIRMTAEIEVSR